MEIEKLVRIIDHDPLCKLMPITGQPTLAHSEDRLPSDLRRFYALCGGAELFLGREFGFRITCPQELLPASSQIVPIDYGKRKKIYDNDISAHWYLLLSSDGAMENVVIDLHPERTGLCYDGYVNTYASSDCFVVASSFTDLLRGVVNGRGSGDSLFWEGKIEGRQYIYEMLDVEPPNA